MAKEKYLIGAIGFYIVLVASAFGTFRKSWVTRGIAIPYLALVAISILHYAVYPNEYSRRVDWTGLRAYLSTSIRQGDIALFYRDHQGEPLDVRPNMKGVKVVYIRTDKPERSRIGEFVAQIDESCQGHIYLINREIDRYSIDPKSETIQTLKQRRLYERKRFGRNLSLYVFKDQQLSFQ
jgi:hypothetical protein